MKFRNSVIAIDSEYKQVQNIGAYYEVIFTVGPNKLKIRLEGSIIDSEGDGSVEGSIK